MRTRKGEATSQMFTYIMGAIIVGVILMFGAGSIMKMIKSGEDISDKVFERNLIGFFENMNSQNYLSERYESFTVVDKFKHICFISKENIQVENVNTGFDEVDISIKAGSADNVYLISDKNIHAFQVSNISNSGKMEITTPGGNVKNGFYCHEIISGKIKLKMQSLGDSVSILNIE